MKYKKKYIYPGNFQVESPTLYSKVCWFILKVKPFFLYIVISVFVCRLFSWCSWYMWKVFNKLLSKAILYGLISCKVLNFCINPICHGGRRGDSAPPSKLFKFFQKWAICCVWLFMTFSFIINFHKIFIKFGTLFQ